jgi:transcriptional regulator with XRE-family HTH domain
MMDVNINIKDIRKAYDLSQADIALAIGVKSRGTVIAIENGERPLTMTEAGKLADYLGLNILDFFSETTNVDKYRETLIETLKSYNDMAKKSLPKTFLAKLIYLIDFAWFYNELQSLTNAKYRRLQYGPVPDIYFRIVDEFVEDGTIKLEYGDRAQLLSIDGNRLKPNEFLTEREKSFINEVVDKWKDKTTTDIVEFTHRQYPWQICRPGEFIPYELITQEDPDNVY